MNIDVQIDAGEAWITDVVDPTQSVHASYPKDESTAHLGGDFRTYAGNRVRIITDGTDVRTHPLTLQWLTPEQVATLMLWRGRVLLLRDGDGRRVFGSYLDCDPDWVWADGRRCALLPLLFVEVTHIEQPA